MPPYVDSLQHSQLINRDIVILKGARMELQIPKNVVILQELLSCWNAGLEWKDTAGYVARNYQTIAEQSLRENLASCLNACGGHFREPMRLENIHDWTASQSRKGFTASSDPTMLPLLASASHAGR